MKERYKINNDQIEFLFLAAILNIFLTLLQFKKKWKNLISIW